MTKHSIKYTFLFSFLLAVLFSGAQSVPGYLGSRLAVGYTLQLSPNFLSSNYSSAGDPVNADDYFSEESFFVGISTVHYLNAEYVITKKSSLIMNVGLSRAYYLPPNFENYGFNELSYEGRPGLTSIPIIMGWRKYTDLLAPIGTFFEFNLGYQIINPDDFTYSGEFYSNELSGTKEVKDQTVSPSNTGAFLAGVRFGKSRVFFDKLKVDFYGSLNIQFPGISLSYTTLGSLADVQVPYDGEEHPYLSPNEKSTQDGFAEQARARMFGSYWACTGISINFLP